MENTLELKERFLLNYQFKHVCFEGIRNSVWYLIPDLVWGTKAHLGNKGLVSIKDIPPLELNSLSSISDEDVIQGILFIYNKSIEDLGEIINIKHYDTFSSIESIEKGCNFKTHRSIHHWNGSCQIGSVESDYFRSKGYALPWMGLSVEKLVEFNWVKLK